MNRLGFAAIALAVIVLAGAATLFSSSPASANPGNIPASGILYATDGGGGSLYSVNPTTGATTPIGSLGVGPFPALAGNATTLYGGTGNDAVNPPGRLYSVNPSGPSAALIGASGLGYAGYGSFDFDNSGVLYASMNLAGGTGTGSDYLVTVATGGGAASVVGPFGTCTGVTIPVPDPAHGGPTGSCTIEGMEAIAFDSSGQLWGIENVRGTGPAAVGLYKINKATGAATFFMAISGGPSDGVVSAQFACNGTLYGGSSRHPDGGRLGTINTTTGAWTYLTPTQTNATWTGGPQFNSMSGLAIVPSICPFNVNKTFVPSDPGSVTVSLSCTDGGVAAATDNTASQTDDANFTVTGFTLNSNPTCTATETGVPAGYTINSCSATLSVGVCTITNHETTTTFTVNKVYSPSGPLTTVPVTVTCTSGTVTTPAGNSGPGAPFSTVVHHFNLTGSTCSASETVPQGYIMTSTCTNVAISDSTPASCTITNTETTTSFTVNKVYSPANPHPAVPVTVTCTSGIVTTPAGTAAPGSPFSTVVHHFNVAGSTCTANETVPLGYTESDNCGIVPISNGVPASCTFTNVPIPPTPNPSAVGGLVDVVTGGSSGSGSAISWLALLALAVVAMGTVAGGTFAVVRKRS
jgi:hypothetical protein